MLGSLVGKIDELVAVASDINPDLILVTESWCHDGITDAFLKIPGYELQTDLRLDREDTAGGTGGGLLVYARESLTILSDDSAGNFTQHQNFKILTGKEELRFSLVYRSPSSRPESVQLLADLVKATRGKRLIVGDINLSKIDWQAATAAGSGAKALLEACQDEFLEQLVDFTTHIKGNILDVVLTNIPERVEVAGIGRLGNSDHEMLKIQISLDMKTEKTVDMVPNWRKADWPAMSKKMGSDNLRAGVDVEGANEA